MLMTCNKARRGYEVDHQVANGHAFVRCGQVLARLGSPGAAQFGHGRA